MKYLPNIIPAEKRVLTEYFQQQSDKLNQGRAKGVTVRYLIACVLFFLAIISLRHFFVSMLVAASALLLLPSCKAWLERNLIFKLTFKITAVIVCVLLLSAAGIDKIYRDRDTILLITAEKEAAAKEKEHAIHEEYLRHRVDSINAFISRNEKLIKVNKYDQVLQEYELAINTTETSEELSILTHARDKTERLKGIYLTTRKKYKLAIPVLSESITRNPDAQLYYNRGLCYANLGQTLEAVTDLRQASKLGHMEAEKLHERINPLLKRVNYYVTRCCDGSSSSAKGRGACSHHGGVCNWNDPVYEYYRKY